MQTPRERGVEIPCLTYPTWSHYVQYKLEIYIYLSLDKYKEVNTNRYFKFWLRAVFCINHLNFYKGSWHAKSPILLKLYYLCHGDTKPSNQHSFHPYACPLPWKQHMIIWAKKWQKSLQSDGFPTEIITLAIPMDWPFLSVTMQSQSFLNPYFSTKYASILQRSLIFE